MNEITSVKGKRSGMRRLAALLGKWVPRQGEGQSVVEFAFVLPVLALMMFAVVDFSRLLLIYISASNGAREGARQGVVYSGCSDSGGATSSSIEAKIRNGTDQVVEWTKVTPVVSYRNGSATPTVVTTPQVGGLITVSLTIPYEPITPLVGPIIGNPNITASSSMVIDQTFACLTATPTRTFTASPTLTVTPTPSPTITSTPLPGTTPTNTPTFTPTFTGTATPTSTACLLPAAPTVTSITRSGNTHTITWSAASGASTYNVYLVGASSNPVLSGVTSTSTTHSQTGSHNHTYYVAGVNICGTGSSSNQLQEP